MTDVTCIGLGSMGSALARALLGAGHTVSVWNRSAAKMTPLVALGAEAAESAGAAVRRSPVSLVCVDNYDVTRDIFSSPDAAATIAERTIVQFSTGTPKEARDAAAHFTSRGASYLDGALMVFPEDIGKPHALVMVAGPRPAHEACGHLLACLGGQLQYLGENVAAAAALDMALLTKVLGQTAGALHAARICEAEGVGVDTLASLLSDIDDVKGVLRTIHEGSFANPGATIQVWHGAVERILRQARDATISHEVPDFISGLFRRAIAMGHDQEHIAALVKVLRAN